MSIKCYRDYRPQLAPSAWVDVQALVVGQVSLAESVSVWPMAVLRGDVGKISVGARTNIQDGAVVHVTHASEYIPQGRDTQIGEDVTVGHSAVIHACTIGDCVLVGMNATVLDGAVVEDEVLIAAGSLVPPGKRLASGWLYAGNPAKPMRELSDEEREFLRYSAAHYVTLAEDYQRYSEDCA
ncbi:gamma carbonic anhydrase family protein [Suttonella sp. R2A3]|uniref:gamma carbonic anhydrase family protein n=1 Tax=Suttonella sp. R2A3 TaxID=2908648 RepID=UPI001F300D18|nr:gamma carbonic anhydrase family protein [Suttonella sp. R2A3]UJF24338.1 gamma carbonic anhydrase family protein [Suttonella sp. R2A3]